MKQKILFLSDVTRNASFEVALDSGVASATAREKTKTIAKTHEEEIFIFERWEVEDIFFKW